MKPPCKDCEVRSVGCHGGCSKYQSWKVVHEEELQQERFNKDVIGYTAREVSKVVMRQRKKKNILGHMM